MINKLIAFFKSFESDNYEIKDRPVCSAYYHEDLFRQVEFVPRENIDFLKKENDKINEFAQNHFDGSGFTDVYMREDEYQIDIFEKEIATEKLDLLLIELGMRKIEDVCYFYCSTTVKSDNTIAYDFNEAQIFVVHEDNFVRDFFVDGFRFHEVEEDKLKLQEILFKVGTEFSLILNDWDLAISIDLENKNEIKKYLNEEF